MKIITETGSQYDIVHSIVTKKDKHGKRVDSFKLWSMKAIPDTATTLLEVLELPDSEPEIGKKLYVSGKDTWWITTKIVSIEPYESDNETSED